VISDRELIERTQACPTRAGRHNYRQRRRTFRKSARTHGRSNSNVRGVISSISLRPVERREYQPSDRLALCSRGRENSSGRAVALLIDAGSRAIFTSLTVHRPEARSASLSRIFFSSIFFFLSVRALPLRPPTARIPPSLFPLPSSLSVASPRSRSLAAKERSLSKAARGACKREGKKLGGRGG